MNEEHKQRMMKLAEALEKLPDERFCFNKVVHHGTPCGTIACAIGWTPAVFPDLVEWTGENSNGLHQGIGLCINGQGMEYSQVAEHLFGISPGEAVDLFSPVESDSWSEDDEDDELPEHPLHPNLRSLGKDANPMAVAAMLRRFLELVDSGELVLSE